MRKRIFSAVVIVLSVASIAVATLIAQRAAQRAKTSPTSAAGGQAATKGKATANRNAGAAQVPLRQPDPNRAPQKAVDEALYTSEEFFGTQATVARPYTAALERVSGLLVQYPKDSRLHLHAARLSERLGQFDKAAAEMTQYADLKRRSPDALRRLANFFHDRARFADEVKTLTDLAKSLPVTERAPIYKQAAGIVRAYSLKEFKPADFFAELVAADPSNVQPVKDYVQELDMAGDHKEALNVLTTFQTKFPGQLEYFLKTRVAVLEELATVALPNRFMMRPSILTGRAPSAAIITNCCAASDAIARCAAPCKSACATPATSTPSPVCLVFILTKATSNRHRACCATWKRAAPVALPNAPPATAAPPRNRQP